MICLTDPYTNLLQQPGNMILGRSSTDHESDGEAGIFI
jgi:hypothetical protein